MSIPPLALRSSDAPMNCIARVVRNVRANPEGLAIWTAKDGMVSMGEFARLVASAQRVLRAAGVGPGDHVLLVALPSPRVYAAMIALFGIGAVGLTVEPWMPVTRIDHVVEQVLPKAFLGSFVGRLWGARIPSVRAIPKWISIGDVRDDARGDQIAMELVAPAARAMVTFTSGTTGAPKGIIRDHAYMENGHVVLRDAIEDGVRGPSLVVFPGVVLHELATGRGAILVPPAWKIHDLLRIRSLRPPLEPQTLACGPAFLRTLLSVPGFESLRSIYVGGAITDCEVIEQSARHWPEAILRHIYGGTEVEPVAITDARDALARSRARGLHQVLHLGGPISAIRVKYSPEGLWVAGPHVAPEYIDAGEDDRRAKQRDSEGVLWHNMGDRIDVDVDGWWYGGRAHQPRGDFALEQRIYSVLGSSAAFIHREAAGEAVLVGEGVRARGAELRTLFPQISRVKEAKIRRDRRHRARIDRAESWRRS
jgi:acyl-coenzyme A synthetase/AMP-(fatty) acid ligase